MIFKKATLDSIIKPLQAITDKLQTFIDDAYRETASNTSQIVALEERNVVLNNEINRSESIMSNINGLLVYGKTPLQN